jgi:hypothetical protein
MEKIMPPYCKFLYLLFFIGLSTPVFAQELYIHQEILDFEKIREEEQLLDSSMVARIYIFLAVQEKAGFTFYAARFELEEDGNTITKDFNNIDFYHEIAYLDKELLIEDDEHICYITAMPKFEELYPESKNPLDESDSIEILAEAHPDIDRCLIGVKSLPIINSSNENIGVERFIAFYNLKPPQKVKKKEGEEAPPKPTTNVQSFGFVEIKFELAQ